MDMQTSSGADHAADDTVQMYRGYVIRVTLTREQDELTYAIDLNDASSGTLAHHAVLPAAPADRWRQTKDMAFQQARAWVACHALPWPFHAPLAAPGTP